MNSPLSLRIQEILSPLIPCNPRRIIVFGSRTRGEADELSDVDVAVILESKEPFPDRILSLGRLLPASVAGVDLLPQRPKRS